jgi:hypothetical protein
MEKIFITLIFNIIVYTNINCQNLIQQIDSIYQSIDTVAYFANMAISCKDKMEEIAKEMEDLDLELKLCSYKRISEDSLHRYYQHWVKERYDKFISKIYRANSVFVLNLLIKKDSIDKGKITLEIDTGKLNFNLFYFDKDYKGDFYVYVNNGQYSEDDSYYITFAPKIGKNAPKVFKKIMRKKPKYLLYCYQLDQMNTILYVLNNKIYVYRIVEMEEYELSDYIKEFGINE